MVLKKKFIARISFFSFLFMLIITAGTVFTSCSNLFENEVTAQESQEEKEETSCEVQKTEETKSDETKTDNREPVIISCQMNISGAIPQELLTVTEEQNQENSRAAIPVYNSSESEYFAVASYSTTNINGSFGTAGSVNENRFTLSLIPGKTWTINCGIRKKNSTAVADRLLTAVMPSVVPENIVSGTTLQFFPVPDTSDTSATGQLDLTMTIDSSIKSVTLSANGSNASSWPFTSATVSGTTATIQTNAATPGFESVPVGVYEVLMAFYDENNALLYATPQNITVCKGLTTRTWITSGGETPINSSGVFNVSSTKIQSFAATNFYVGPSGATGAASPSDTNSGSHKAPFETLGRALSQIATYGVSTNDYKIHISGEQKVAATATSGFEISGLDSHMNSLTLEGLNNNETDILNGDARFRTLKISSAKEVTVKNLTIKNGSVNTIDDKNGGGIGKSGTGKLTLENCIVSGNTAENAGGGLCTFENAGDCEIKNCHFESNTAGTNGGAIYSRSKTQITNTEIIGNDATAAGGGCYFRDKDITISGTQTLISGNTTATHGGGICAAENSTLLLSDATISANEAQLYGGGIYTAVPFAMTSGSITGNSSLQAEDSSLSSGGGGVCTKSTFIMSGGVISGNEAASVGGGVFLSGNNSKLILSGDAVIGDISKDSPATSAENMHSNKASKGGGIFNLNGKLYIGYTDESNPDTSFSGGVGYNFASVHGGGVYSISVTPDVSEAYLNNTKIIANASGTFAGGIDVYNGTLEIKNCEIKKNKSETGGGLGIGRTEGNPTCLIKDTVIQNNNAVSIGAGIYFYGGNVTLSDVEITDNHAGVKAGGIFFNAVGTNNLILGTSAAASTIKVIDNTAGTSNSRNNVYLNTNDVIAIAGALNTDSEIGITKATLPAASVFTAGFKLKNPSTSAASIFSSDDSTYEVIALALTGEAKLRPTGVTGPALTWFYAAGNTCMALSAEEVERIGLPAYHDATGGTGFTLDKTSSGPFYDAETNDAAIFTGNIRLDDPATGTLVTAGTETSAGIPYTIAADAIDDDTNIYILLTIGSVYLDPEIGNDDNGGWCKDYPVQTVAQAKDILLNNTKTNPAIMVMSKISDSSEISALSNLTWKDDGSISVYNGAIVKRQADFTSDSMLNITSALTLENVTLDGGAIWTSTDSQIIANPSLLTARDNTSSNNGVHATKYLISASSASTLNNVTIQNCDNTSNGNTGYGAAVYTTKTITLNNCIIKDCSSIGGAIYASSSGAVNATDTSFSFNFAKLSGTTSYGNGGAVYLYGGTNSGAGATFNNCSFRYNGALKNGGAIYAANKNSVTFQNMASAVIEHNSAASNGNFMWSAASNLKLLGNFAFGTSPNQVDFYINNSGSDHKIQLGSGFSSTETTGQALIYLAKSFEESVGKVILAPVSGDTTVNIATAKSKFALAGTDANYYEIYDTGIILRNGTGTITLNNVTVSAATFDGTSSPGSTAVFTTGRDLGTIKSLIVSDHETTQGEYETFCKYGGNSPSDTYGDGENYPAYFVSWYDAVVYCNRRSISDGYAPVYSVGGETDPAQWLGIIGNATDGYCAPSDCDWYVVTDDTKNGWRLPYEAEWEYIWREGNLSATNQHTYCGGDTPGAVAWYTENSSSKNHIVKTRAPNSLGVYDMCGNVWEWMNDWHIWPIPSSTPITGVNYATADPKNHVTRSGGWRSSASGLTASGARNSSTNNYRNDDLGFRVVRNSETTTDAYPKLVDSGYIGTKTPSEVREVGDIIFSDGSAIPYTESLTLTSTQSAAAIAVIFYKGTGLNSGDDTTTVRTLGVGLVQLTSGPQWAVSGASAIGKNITAIQSHQRNGDVYGKDNFTVISDFLDAQHLSDNTIINDTTTLSNYPAFNFAINYKEAKLGSETVSRLTGTVFETGWYLPTMEELYQCYLVKTTVNAAIDLCNGQKLERSYWTSNQNDGYHSNANNINFVSANMTPNGTDMTKGYQMAVCAIREF